MEIWQVSVQGGRWNFRFERPFNDWEKDLVEDFIGI